MNELKPYIKFFNKNTKLYIIIFMIVGIVMNILPVFILKIFGEASKTNLSTIVNPILTYITILLFVYGVNIANKDFSGALSIRADRKSCIKAIVIDLIILSFVISILGIVLYFFIEVIYRNYNRLQYRTISFTKERYDLDIYISTDRSFNIKYATNLFKLFCTNMYK